MRDLPESLLRARVQFWACLNPEHSGVTWAGDVACCDICGLTSGMTREFARGVQRHERERIARRASEVDATYIHAAGALVPGFRRGFAALIRSEPG